MKNQEKRLKSEHSDDYVEIRAGLVAFKGNVGKLVAVGIGGLGIYAGYRWIKGYFDRKYKNDKSKDETNSASSSNEINQEYQTIFPTATQCLRSLIALPAKGCCMS
mgnify:CR=1 FL=1